MLQYLLKAYLQSAASQKLRETALDAVRQQMAGGPTAADVRPGETAPEGPQREDRQRPCDVGLVFALGIESGGMQDLLEGAIVTHGGGHKARQGGLKGRHVVLLESGIGREAAAKATEALILGHKPAWIISTGFAGGLQPHVKRGDVIMADGVADPAGQTLAIDLRISREALAATPGVHVGRLVTVDAIVRTAAEKQALGQRHQALGVDMETFAVAQVCANEGIRFMAVRIVSDGMSDELPRDIDRLVRQKTTAARLGAALGAIVDRPGSLKDMWRLKEDALVHSDRLARFLASMIAQLVPMTNNSRDESRRNPTDEQRP
jgi:adenosylhomocysteine nucleosidase